MMPSTAANNVAAATRRKVTGIARASESTTADPSRPIPKSGFPTNTPRTPFSHKKYRTGGGTSNWSSRVNDAIRKSRFGSVLKRRSAVGSPEIAATLYKIKLEPKRMTPKTPSRLRTKATIVCVFPSQLRNF